MSLRRASLARVRDAKAQFCSPPLFIHPSSSSGGGGGEAGRSALGINIVAVLLPLCPSLLLALRSALLPVNLPALLWSGSDRRAQLAAPCQGCRGPNGDSDIHPSARPFYAELTNEKKKRKEKKNSPETYRCESGTNLRRHRVWM